MDPVLLSQLLGQQQQAPQYSGPQQSQDAWGDTWKQGAMQSGQQLFSSLADMVGGPSSGEKRLKETYSKLSNRLGMDVLNPDQYLADYYRQNAERWGQQDEMRSKRVGMDSFLFANASRGQRDREALNYYGGMQAQNDLIKSQNDMNILRQMEEIGARLG